MCKFLKTPVCQLKYEITLYTLQQGVSWGQVPNPTNGPGLAVVPSSSLTPRFQSLTDAVLTVSIFTPHAKHISLNLADSGRGPGTAVQGFPEEGVPAAFSPSCSWNITKVVKGLHSWQHVCGHPMGGEVLGSGSFPMGTEVLFDLPVQLQAEMQKYVQNRRWVKSPLKAKVVLPFMLMEFGSGLLCLASLVLKIQNSLQNTKAICQLCKEQRHLPEAHKCTTHFNRWFMSYCGKKDTKKTVEFKERNFWEFKMITNFWICFLPQGNTALQLMMQQFATPEDNNCTICCSLKLPSNNPARCSWH